MASANSRAATPSTDVIDGHVVMAFPQSKCLARSYQASSRAIVANTLTKNLYLPAANLRLMMVTHESPALPARRAVFAPCYVALDWVSYVQPLGSFNITPWNPQPALAIVWMLLGGLRYLPVVLVASFSPM